MTLDIATPVLSREEIADRLRPIVLSVLRIEMPAHALTEETNLYELGLESLNVVELLTEVEAAFDITVDVEDLSAELFTQFGTVVSFVQRKADEA